MGTVPVTDPDLIGWPHRTPLIQRRHMSVVRWLIKWWWRIVGL
jgi:hypothetical protein